MDYIYSNFYLNYYFYIFYLYSLKEYWFSFFFFFFFLLFNHSHDLYVLLIYGFLTRRRLLTYLNLLILWGFFILAYYTKFIYFFSFTFILSRIHTFLLNFLLRVLISSDKIHWCVIYLALVKTERLYVGCNQLLSLTYFSYLSKALVKSRFCGNDIFFQFLWNIL